ncbi:hypothetical protein V8E53_007160 [Lactarius tabidus]
MILVTSDNSGVGKNPAKKPNEAIAEPKNETGKSAIFPELDLSGPPAARNSAQEFPRKRTNLVSLLTMFPVAPTMTDRRLSWNVKYGCEAMTMGALAAETCASLSLNGRWLSEEVPRSIRAVEVQIGLVVVVR